MYDILPVLPPSHFPSVFWPCDRGSSFSTRCIFCILSLRGFLQKKQVRGGFGLTLVLVIFRTLDSSSFCMGKTFDLLLNSSWSLPFTSSVVRSSSPALLSVFHNCLANCSEIVLQISVLQVILLMMPVDQLDFAFPLDGFPYRHAL